MKMSIIKNALFLTVAGVLYHSHADDASRRTQFFDSVAARFQAEYSACTGDNRPMDVRRIIQWKQKMDAWMETEEYAGLLNDYKKSGGAPLSPCKLIEWSRQRKAAQEAKEAVFVKEMLDSQETAEAMREIKAQKPSRFDFADLPFGISKLTFVYFFKKKFTLDLLERGRFLYVEEFPLSGRDYLAAFFFNDDGIFYKYEIESDPLPADSLNRVVRPSADHLALFFEKRLGPPAASARIGFYDIKSKELALLKKWDTPDNSLVIGLSVFDYHYYAKAVVADKKLLKATEELKEKRSAEE
jgi:hypothetical protein